MTFLLFAARTIQIKRELNAKNYELTLITDKFNEATKKVGEKQQAIIDMQNNFKNGTSMFTQLGQSAAMVALRTQAGEEALQNVQAVNAAISQGTQAGSALATAANSIFDNIVGSQQKAELARLQAQASALETRKTALETETALLKEEYDSYKSQTKEGVQDAVPHFGLA